MLCSQCQELLSDYIDGLLELGEQSKIEAHISQCESCLIVRDDLLQIVHFSKNLPLHSPSSSVWMRIKAEIEATRRKGLSAQAGRFWAKVSSQGLRFRSEWVTVAAIAISVSALVFVYQRGSVISTPPAVVQTQVPNESSANKDAMDSNIRDMEQRIDNLKAVVDERSAGWNPQIKSSFNRDMSYIDQTLAQCHHDLTDDPQDDVCRELMLNAYREKVRLLEGFNDF
jgi:anti-sigma-K factor RskA